MARLVAAAVATDGLVSHSSALWLHGLTDNAPHPPQVLVPVGRRGTRSLGATVTRTRTLQPPDATRVRGIPVTSVARTLADLAAVGCSPRRLRGLVIDAERTGRLLRDDLAALHERRRPGVPGRGSVGAVPADLGSMRSDSTTEQDVRTGLRAAGFGVHPEPFPFVCDDGVTVHLDLALPEHWVHIEVDGFGAHTGRRVFETDRVRWTQIVRHWRPVWVTWERWHEQRDAVVADVAAAIALADPTRPPAVPGQPAPRV